MAQSKVRVSAPTADRDFAHRGSTSSYCGCAKNLFASSRRPRDVSGASLTANQSTENSSLRVFDQLKCLLGRPARCIADTSVRLHCSCTGLRGFCVVIILTGQAPSTTRSTHCKPVESAQTTILRGLAPPRSRLRFGSRLALTCRSWLSLLSLGSTKTKWTPPFLTALCAPSERERLISKK